MDDRKKSDDQSGRRKHQTPVLARRLERPCPRCDKHEVFVIESAPGKRFGYYCKGCESVYHAKLVFNVPRKKHVWLGRLLNPAYWDLENHSLEEGFNTIGKRDDARTPEYLDEWEMEDESSDK